MGRIRGHATLKEDRPLFVLKAQLVCDGQEFKKGDPFPWQELAGVTPRLLRLLWDQRKIGHEQPAADPQGAEDPLRSPQEQAKADARSEGRKKPPAKPGGARGLG